MRNRQIHNDTGLSLINIWIKSNLKTLRSCHYQLGRKTQNERLRPRLPQDILLTNTKELSSEDDK